LEYLEQVAGDGGRKGLGHGWARISRITRQRKAKSETAKGAKDSRRAQRRPTQEKSNHREQGEPQGKARRKLMMRGPVWPFVVGVALGVCAGVLDVAVGDLLLTALLVLAATLGLGMWRPERPWRWTLTVGACVPVVRAIAYFVLREKPDRAQMYESLLAFLTGVAGAYGGSVVRNVWGRLEI
jgi:hypothetical protein